MAKLYTSEYGRAMVTQYKKEEIINQIGINRLIYDLICKGDLNNTIQLINRVVLKNDHTLEEFITDYISNYTVSYTEETRKLVLPIVMCIPGTLIPGASIRSEEEALHSTGFVKFEGLSPNIFGHVNDPMVYFDETSMEMIDVLIEKRLIKDAK